MRRLSLVFAAGTALVLFAMTGVSLATGATQELHEHYHVPAVYAEGLRAHASGLRWLMGLDIAFCCVYTAFFGALAAYLRSLGQPFTRIAFGAMLAVCFLDIIEDHHILALLAVAEANRPIDESSIVFQDVLSATKFSISYVALFLYGLAVPRTSRLAWALVFFLTVGTLFTAVVGYAIPGSLDSGRWIGFLVGFGVAAAWLRTAPEPAEAA